MLRSNNGREEKIDRMRRRRNCVAPSLYFSVRDEEEEDDGMVSCTICDCKIRETLNLLLANVL